MDSIRQIVAWEVLFIAIFSSLLLIQNISGSNLSFVTGRASQTLISKEAVLKDIESLAPKLDFLKDVNDGDVCIIVNMDSSTKYSYELIKLGDAVSITTSDNEFCKGQSTEDFIFSYVSYDKLKEQVDSPPTFQQLKTTANGKNFYVLPSRFVAAGFSVNNVADFTNKYGNFVKKYFTTQEISDFLNPKTPETQQTSAITSYLFYLIGGGVLVIIIISVLLLKFAKKPEIEQDLELVSYIKSSLAQGYPEEQVRQLLVQSGWSQDQIQKAFQTVNSGVVAPKDLV